MRYSGISPAVEVAGAIGGGLAPMVATRLLAKGIGAPAPLSGYLSALGAIVGVWFMKRPRLMSQRRACYGLTVAAQKSAVPRITLTFPVMVVDSPLFECVLQPDGKLALTEVQRGEFLFSAHFPTQLAAA